MTEQALLICQGSNEPYLKALLSPTRAIAFMGTGKKEEENIYIVGSSKGQMDRSEIETEKRYAAITITPALATASRFKMDL